MQQDAQTRAEVRRRRESQVKQARFWRYIRDFARPSYHWHRFVEDLKAARHALANRDLEVLRSEPEALAHAFRGRLFATYVLSGPAGIIGVTFGIASQYISRNPFLGYIYAVVINNILITVAFQVIWGISNRGLYSDESQSRWDWFKRLQRDLLPLQWEAFKLALIIIVLVVPVVLGVIKGVEMISEKAALAIPFAGVGAAIELAVQNVTLVRLMGDLFERQSRILANRHKTTASPVDPLSA